MNVNKVEIEIVVDEVEKLSAWENHYNNIPNLIRTEVGRYAVDHNAKDSLENFSKQYLKFTFKRESINSWKISLKKIEITKLLTKMVDQFFYMKQCFKRRRVSSLAHV